MKAAVFGVGGAIELKERDLPEPRPGWVRLAIVSGGICGTDLHLHHEALGPSRGIQPGHEMAGLVDAVGDGVTTATGTLVAVEPILVWCVPSLRRGTG